MSASTLLLPLARHLPSLFGGARFHRAALAAAAGGDAESANGLFELAVACYRREWRVEPLARLRVHQAIVRLKAGLIADPTGEEALEVERRLTRLTRIESLEPPFELIDARQMLASWTATTQSGDAEPVERESLAA